MFENTINRASTTNMLSITVNFQLYRTYIYGPNSTPLKHNKLYNTMSMCLQNW